MGGARGVGGKRTLEKWNALVTASFLLAYIHGVRLWNFKFVFDYGPLDLGY